MSGEMLGNAERMDHCDAVAQGSAKLAVRRYIRDGSLFRENSAGKLGL